MLMYTYNRFTNIESLHFSFTFKGGSMINHDLKYLSLLNQLCIAKTPLDKAIVGFKLITRTPLDDCYDLFWILNESLQSDFSTFQANLKQKVNQALLGQCVKFNAQDTCVSVPNEKLVMAFQDAVGGHLSHKRKGLLERPYLHHVMMVWYLVALCGGNLNQQIAALLHDFSEDVPDKSLKLSTVKRVFLYKYGKTATKYIFSMKNKEGLSGKTPEKSKEKHEWQLSHLEKMVINEQLIKLCDRLANKYDMRRDGPASLTPEKILGELQKWREFADVCRKAPQLVYDFQSYVEGLLFKQYSL